MTSLMIGESYARLVVPYADAQCGLHTLVMPLS